jgi:hypothetical protein
MSPEERLVAGAIGDMARTPQGRKTLLVLAMVALLIWGGYWLYVNKLRHRHPVGPTVRLATWNLRQFSVERPHVDLRVIANVIKSNNFDLVAIQEVKHNGEEVDRLLNELGIPWRATHLSAMTGNSERFVFVYNGDHVQENGSPHFITASDASVFDRTPYQATFRAGNFDFTLITVHLSYADTDRRRREAEALSHFVSNVQSWNGSERDVIVLGDFNEQGRGNLHYFEDIGWESLNHDPSNLSSTETYDTLLIDPKYTGEWNGTAASVHFDETLFGNDDKRALDDVSDHRPTYADFVTNLPDDD